MLKVGLETSETRVDYKWIAKRMSVEFTLRDPSMDVSECLLASNAEKEWSEHTMALPPLKVGDTVMIQNQSGNHPLRWDKRGTIVKAEGFD